MADRIGMPKAGECWIIRWNNLGKKVMGQPTNVVTYGGHVAGTMADFQDHVESAGGEFVIVEQVNDSLQQLSDLFDLCIYIPCKTVEGVPSTTLSWTALGGGTAEGSRTKGACPSDIEFMSCEKIKLVKSDMNNDNRGCGSLQGISIAYFGDWQATKFNMNGQNMLTPAGHFMSYSSWNGNFDNAWVPMAEQYSQDTWNWLNAGKPCYRYMSTISCAGNYYDTMCLRLLKALRPQHVRFEQAKDDPDYMVGALVTSGPDCEVRTCTVKTNKGLEKRIFDPNGNEIDSFLDFLVDKHSHLLDQNGNPHFSKDNLIRIGAKGVTPADAAEQQAEDYWRACLKSCEFQYPEIPELPQCDNILREEGCIWAPDAVAGDPPLLSQITKLTQICPDGSQYVDLLLPPGVQEDIDDEVPVDTDALDLSNPGWYFSTNCDEPTPPLKVQARLLCDSTTKEKVEFCIFDDGSQTGPFYPGTSVLTETKGPYEECVKLTPVGEMECYFKNTFEDRWDNGAFRAFDGSSLPLPDASGNPKPNRYEPGAIDPVSGEFLGGGRTYDCATGYPQTSNIGVYDKRLGCGTATIDEIHVDGTDILGGTPVTIPASNSWPGMHVPIQNALVAAGFNATVGIAKQYWAGDGVAKGNNFLSKAEHCADFSVTLIKMTDCTGRQWCIEPERFTVASVKCYRQIVCDDAGNRSCVWYAEDKKTEIDEPLEECLIACEDDPDSPPCPTLVVGPATKYTTVGDPPNQSVVLGGPFIKPNSVMDINDDHNIAFCLEDHPCFADLDPSTKLRIRYTAVGHNLEASTAGYNFSLYTGGATSLTPSGAMLVAESASNTRNNSTNFGTPSAEIGESLVPGSSGYSNTPIDRWVEFDVPLSELLACMVGRTCAYGGFPGTKESLADCRIELMTDLSEICDCDSGSCCLSVTSDSTSVTPAETKTCTVEFKSSGLDSIVTDKGTITITPPNNDFSDSSAGANSAEMQAAQAEIQAFLDANGGGTVVLSYPSTSILNIEITGTSCDIQTADDNSNPGPHAFTCAAAKKSLDKIARESAGWDGENPPIGDIARYVIGGEKAAFESLKKFRQSRGIKIVEEEKGEPVKEEVTRGDVAREPETKEEDNGDKQ